MYDTYLDYQGRTWWYRRTDDGIEVSDGNGCWKPLPDDHCVELSVNHLEFLEEFENDNSRSAVSSDDGLLRSPR